jgi:ribonuclease P/MRP protein subunit POP5
MKAFLPTLKEKKRYLAIEILSQKNRKHSFTDVSKAIWASIQGFIGSLGAGNAGIWFVEDKWRQNVQRGLIRVNNKFIDPLRASLSFIKKVDNDTVMVNSIGASGSIKKAEDKYLR